MAEPYTAAEYARLADSAESGATVGGSIVASALRIAAMAMKPGVIERAVALNDNEPRQDWGRQAAAIRKALTETTDV